MPDIWGLSAIAVKFALSIGGLTSAGLIFGALTFQVSNVRRLAILFASIALLASVLDVSLRGAALTGDVSGMIDPEMLGLLWSTPVGTAFVYRLVGLILLIVGAMVGGPYLWISAFGGVLALWSFASIGHIPNKGMPWLNVLLLIHLGAIALWIGILPPLKRLAKERAVAAAADLGHRFGKLAAIFVPLLLCAGLIMSYIMVGSGAALIGTAYGQALLLKVLVVAFLLSLATLNKLRIVPKLLAGEARAVRHLSRSLSFEWIAFVTVLLTTAVLTSVLNVPP